TLERRNGVGGEAEEAQGRSRDVLRPELERIAVDRVMRRERAERDQVDRKQCPQREHDREHVESDGRQATRESGANRISCSLRVRRRSIRPAAATSERTRISVAYAAATCGFR